MKHLKIFESLIDFTKDLFNLTDILYVYIGVPLTWTVESKNKIFLEFVEKLKEFNLEPKIIYDKKDKKLTHLKKNPRSGNSYQDEEFPDEEELKKVSILMGENFEELYKRFPTPNELGIKPSRVIHVSSKTYTEEIPGINITVSKEKPEDFISWDRIYLYWQKDKGFYRRENG